MPFRVGPALGIEWTLYGDKLYPQALEHGLDHMIAPDVNSVGMDFGRAVTVAQMPGNAMEAVSRVRLYLDQIFLGRLHRDPAAAFHTQAVATAKGHRVFKIEQYRSAVCAIQPDPSAMSCVVVEGHRADSIRQGPVSPCHGFDGSFHTTITSEQEIALRHGQNIRRLANQMFAIGPDLVGFRIHLDGRRRVVEGHGPLADAAARVGNRQEIAFQP